MSAVSSVPHPAEMFSIKYLLTETEIPPLTTNKIPKNSKHVSIGRKPLLNKEEFDRFIEIVEEFEKYNGMKMTWKIAARILQEILNRKSKVSRTSAARYLKLAEMKGGIL